MTAPAPKQFAGAIIVDIQGRYLLQRRDNKPEIRSPGRIGLFGGHQEIGETSLECVVREVHEEIGCYIPPESFEYVATYCGLEASGTFNVEIFATFGVDIAGLTITEGTLLVVQPEDLFNLMDELTASAAFAFAFEAFVGRQESG